MNTYPFLNNLFTAVLQQSKTIEGRFFIATSGGREINSDVLGQLLTETLTNIPLKKYPLAYMMPPAMMGSFAAQDAWAELRITMFFLRTSFYMDNQIEALNENTQTSTRHIMNDWGDMGKAAAMFLRALYMIYREPGNNTLFRLIDDRRAIVPVTSVGMDKASGVRLDFSLSLYVGCELEDYDDISLLMDSINYNYQKPVMPSNVEIIPFTELDATVPIIVDWTTDRKQKFGLAPDISVYTWQLADENNPGMGYRFIRSFNFSLQTDQMPPDQNAYYITVVSPGDGYIQLK